MAKRKSILDQLGDVLRGKPKEDPEAAAKEEARRLAEQAKEQARRQAERAKAAAERKAAQLQRELKEKERELKAREEELARAEAEHKKEEIRAQIQRQKEAIEARKAEIAAAPEPRVYVVQPGDSLSKIAKTLYGDANRWPEIFEANKDQIKDPNLIYPDQKIRIP